MRLANAGAIVYLLRRSCPQDLRPWSCHPAIDDTWPGELMMFREW